MNQIPLVLTSSRIISSPSDNGLVKKFRASEHPDPSNPNLQYDKNLNEKFLELSIDSRLQVLSLNDETVKIEEEMAPQMLSIPNPIKFNPECRNEVPLSTPPNNPNFLENLIKMSQNDVSGISKYLNLDLNSKLSTWDKITSTSNPKEKFRMGTVVTSFLNSPFNMPFLNSELFSSQGTGLSDSQGSCSTQSGSGSAISKFNMKKNLIGTLTADERQEKVTKYIEKKKKRKDVPTVKYQKRKDLADKRDRIQGKFAKTPKMFDRTNILEQLKDQGKEKMGVEYNCLQNNSDLVFNNLTLSSESLGKRMNKSDLIEDFSASMEPESN